MKTVYNFIKTIYNFITSDTNDFTKRMTLQSKLKDIGIIMITTNDNKAFFLYEDENKNYPTGGNYLVEYSTDDLILFCRNAFFKDEVRDDKLTQLLDGTN